MTKGEEIKVLGRIANLGKEHGKNIGNESKIPCGPHLRDEVEGVNPNDSGRNPCIL